MLVSARVATWMPRRGGLDQYHRSHQGTDVELDQTILALKLASLAWREQRDIGTGRGTNLADTPPRDAPSPEWWTTTTTARDLGITSRAVVKAIADGRLPARSSAGRWWLNPEDVAHFRARRAAA